MTNIRALIAEDEPLLAMALAGALQRLWPELAIVAVAENGIAAVQKALEERPDVLFLDIKMPGQSGLEAAQELADVWAQGPQDGTQTQPFPLVVFVTAYDEYALAAFEQAAADYVCKPVSDDRLTRTVERLKDRLQARLHKPQEDERSGGSELERLLGQLHSLLPGAGTTGMAGTTAPQRLSLIRAAVGNQVRMIPIEDVVYFEATDKYVTVTTQEGESLIRTSLKELLPQLDPERFWQIHRGTVVNNRCIAAAVRDEAGKISLRLHDRSDTLTVSRVFAHLFRQM
ncbi:LytR/AlgR family response regulator transcription factor [Noviherbaspirillum sedimenti]|uniref:DNA-binding response regulator n=1 Tax=Noviherbaspirillum sedimenti TaxID=2320865 RepID=A0A3A3G5Z6_9BURK|nr:LytTR family DNA-binding domain-containing protein [Noviherbaspirillum sedimenti]RJG03947.1 DNA-binding response regulator [Noviherbaspirillum sedimenti]